MPKPIVNLYSILLLIGLSCSVVNAATLEGVVLDDNTKLPVENSGAVLMDELGEIYDFAEVNATGVFIFTDIPAGIYSLTVYEPPGYLPVFSTAGTKGVAVQPNAVFDINITSNDQLLRYAFDIVVAPYNSIFEGSVFSDENDNGSQDPDEFGIPNVEISAIDDTEYEETTRTDANGRYQFVLSTIRSVEIRETQPQGWQDGKESPSIVTTVNDSYSTQFLNGGELITGLTFGERGVYNLVEDTWELVSLPVIPPETENTVMAVLGDDISEGYGTGWILYGFDSSAGNYITLDEQSSIEPGQGYWLKQISDSPVELDWPAGSLPASPEFHLACPAANKECVKLDITVPDTVSSWHLLGYPLAHTTDIAGIRVVSTSSPCDIGCTLEEAHMADIIQSPMFEYKNNSYNSLPSSNQLTPWTGFWVRAMEGARDSNVSILIPPGPLEF